MNLEHDNNFSKNLKKVKFYQKLQKLIKILNIAGRLPE